MSGAEAAGTPRALFAERLLDGGSVRRDVLIEVDGHGRIASLAEGATAPAGAVRLGTATAGSGNAHSHAFHRALRGRTHDSGGDFWLWREAMYRLAAVLDPESYGHLAEAAYAEMVVCGYTAVGEFHYLHHRPDGTPYPDPNAVGAALVRAAGSVGIRLTLLDACYLEGGPGRPLAAGQRRFSDGSAQGWLDRWHALAPLASDRVVIGAAIHSVRAVPPGQIKRIAATLPDAVPLHLHLSEQPAENEQALARYGRTPTRLLADAGALGPRLTAVHATHLTGEDIRLLGEAAVTVAFCPSTEADLGDGIGPARALAEAGVVLSLGSDQNAVVDPFLELRALEAGERLSTRSRGRFSPAELDAARSSGGYRALGLHSDAYHGDPHDRGLRVGAPADLIEVNACSVRTAGACLAQLPLAATAADVTRVFVGGELVARDGLLADGRDPAAMLRDALGRLPARAEP